MGAPPKSDEVVVLGVTNEKLGGDVADRLNALEPAVVAAGVLKPNGLAPPPKSNAGLAASPELKLNP